MDRASFPCWLILCLLLGLLVPQIRCQDAPASPAIHAGGFGELVWGDPVSRAQELFEGGQVVVNEKLRVRLGYRSSDTYYADEIYRLGLNLSLLFFEGRFAGIYRSVPGPDDVDLADQENRIRRAISQQGEMDLSELVVRVLKGPRRAFQGRLTAILVGHDATLEQAASEYFLREDEKKRRESEDLAKRLLDAWEPPIVSGAKKEAEKTVVDLDSLFVDPKEMTEEKRSQQEQADKED